MPDPGKRWLSSLSSQRLLSGGGGSGRKMDSDVKSMAPSLEKPHRAPC